MSDEEMERKIEFIVDQQSHFAVNMDLLGERFNQLTERVDQIAEHVDELAQAQIRTEQTVEQLARVQNHVLTVVGFIGDTQVRTDERLNSLMSVVERFISEGQNGRAS